MLLGMVDALLSPCGQSVTISWYSLWTGKRGLQVELKNCCSTLQYDKFIWLFLFIFLSVHLTRARHRLEWWKNDCRMFNRIRLWLLFTCCDLNYANTHCLICCCLHISHSQPAIYYHFSYNIYHKYSYKPIQFAHSHLQSLTSEGKTNRLACGF
jgi:hypothetical protein